MKFWYKKEWKMVEEKYNAEVRKVLEGECEEFGEEQILDAVSYGGLGDMFLNGDVQEFGLENCIEQAFMNV